MSKYLVAVGKLKSPIELGWWHSKIGTLTQDPEEALVWDCTYEEMQSIVVDISKYVEEVILNDEENIYGDTLLAPVYESIRKTTREHFWSERTLKILNLQFFYYVFISNRRRTRP
jgi:hypothetical protein